MNKVTMTGRLTKNPELRFTPGKGTGVTNVTIAVDKYNSSTGQREADFIPLVIWGKQAEAVCNNLVKGSKIAIVGKLQSRTHEKDGDKRYIVEVVVEETEFLGNPKEKDDGYVIDPEYVEGESPLK